MICKRVSHCIVGLAYEYILVIHRAELDIIGRKACNSCSLASTVRHDDNDVKAAVTSSRTMFKIGVGNDEGRCHTLGVDVKAWVTC